MLFELIALGGWLFWGVLVVAFIIEFIAVGYEKVWPTVIVPVVLGLIVSLFTSFNTISYCKENWQAILWGIGIYIVMACVWATFKWFRRSIRRGKIYSIALEKWAADNMPSDVTITSINDIPMDKRLHFLAALKNAFYQGTEDEVYGRECWDITVSALHPWTGESGTDFQRREKENILDIQRKVLKKVFSSPKDCKERFTVWMVAWPLSMLTTVIFDFLFDFFSWLRKLLNNFFVEISRMAFGKYRKDFDSITVEKEL